MFLSGLFSFSKKYYNFDFSFYIIYFFSRFIHIENNYIEHKYKLIVDKYNFFL